MQHWVEINTALEAADGLQIEGTQLKQKEDLGWESTLDHLNVEINSVLSRVKWAVREMGLQH